MMVTLRKALEEGKLEEFIKEHEAAPKGDSVKADHLLRSMAQTSKEVPKASSGSKRGG